MELEAMFNGGAPESAAEPVNTTTESVAAPEQTVTTETSGQPRGEDGKFAPKPKAEEVPAPAAGDVAKEKPDPRYNAAVAQANDERRKRQELERQLQELRAAQQQPVPDPLSDPDGFGQSIDQRLMTYEQRMQEQIINVKVDASVSYARRAHADFDEVMGHWAAAVQENPELYARAVREDDPGEFAYQQAKRHRAISEIGSDPDAYRQKLMDEIRSSLEAEFKKSTPSAPAAPAASLASVGGGGRMSDAANQPTQSLESFFKR